LGWFRKIGLPFRKPRLFEPGIQPQSSCAIGWILSVEFAEERIEAGFPKPSLSDALRGGDSAVDHILGRQSQCPSGLRRDLDLACTLEIMHEIN